MNKQSRTVLLKISREMMELLIVILLFLLVTSLGAQAREIEAEQAASHIGKTVTVRGTIANVYTSRAGNTFINFGRPYPNQTFTAVVFRNRASQFTNLNTLEGQEVRVTGQIRLYKGKPEIILESPGKLRH